MEAPHAQVGIGVLVFKEGKILLGKRRNAHGDSEYAGPGGHLEFGESFEACAQRETREEAGIEIENLRFLDVSNILIWKGKHYVDICMMADWKSGEPEVREPDKKESWEWYPLDAIPEPLFAPMHNHLAALKTGKYYFGTIQ